MGTRSHIGLVDENKNVKFIYCHWDGYPTYNGVLLNTQYQDEDKIKALLAMGDVSSLGANPITKEDWNELSDEQKGEHTNIGFRVLTLSYGNWRDEVCPARQCTLEEFVKQDKESWIEYKYYFEEGVWHCINHMGMEVEIPDKLDEGE
jgi:hypothetical protein